LIIVDKTEFDKHPDIVVGAFEEVQIGGVTGQYVQGGWHSDCCGWIWGAEPFLKRLRWQKDGMAFEITAMNMNDLTKEDMIAIAESIK
jgi:hypothetical protein